MDHTKDSVGMVVYQYCLQAGSMCCRKFDPGMRQYISRVPCPWGLTVVQYFPTIKLGRWRYRMLELAINQQLKKDLHKLPCFLFDPETFSEANGFHRTPQAHIFGPG